MKTWLSRIVCAPILAATVALAACNGGPAESLGAQPSPATRGHLRDAGSSSCLSMTCVYIYSRHENHPFNSEITSYASTASGHVQPLARISGYRTRMDNAGVSMGVAVGSDYKIYVAGQTQTTSHTSDVNVYAAGANGNASPIATISGSNTGMISGGDVHVAVDNDGNIYVASNSGYGTGGAITVYAAGASGNVAPIQAISGSDTGLTQPEGIAVDSAHNIYVTNQGAPSVTVYAAGSNGNVAPIQEIEGSSTQLGGSTGAYFPVGMAIDSADNIYVTIYVHAVLVFAAGATGNVAPIRAISGGNTDLQRVTGVALDPSDNIYVTNSGSNFVPSWVAVFQAGANGNVSPIQVIEGAKTHLRHDTSNGIAVR